MPALILDGTKIAQQIRSEAGAEVKTMMAAGLRPGLAVVLGGRAAAEDAVHGKFKMVSEVRDAAKKLTMYLVERTEGDKEYAVHVSPEGKILDVDEDSD